MKVYGYKALKKNHRPHGGGKVAWKPGRIFLSSEGGWQDVGGIVFHDSLQDAASCVASPSAFCLIETIGDIKNVLGERRCDSIYVIRHISDDELDWRAGFRLSEVHSPRLPLSRRPKNISARDLLIQSARRINRLSQELAADRLDIDSVFVASLEAFGDGIFTNRGRLASNCLRLALGHTLPRVLRPITSAVSAVRGTVLTLRQLDKIRDSVWLQVCSYLTSLFPSIYAWKGLERMGYWPWRDILSAWDYGYIASYDGDTWRLHAGSKAKIVAEDSAP